jgi:hypothetical protein
VATYTVESRDNETGLVARWRGVTKEVMDWIRSEQPTQSEMIERMGAPADIFWPEPSGG